MTHYALIEAGIVREVIAPLTIEGKDIPIDDRYPPHVIAQMVEMPDESIKPGDAYRNGEFVKAEPVVPPPPAAADVLGLRDVRLREATLRIDPLQDAEDLGDATPQESAALLLWKQYRVALNRIDQQPGFPAEVVWPEQPQ